MPSGTGIGEFFVSIGVDAAEGALTVGNLVQGFGNLEIATIAEIGLLWEMTIQLGRATDAGIKAALGFEQFTMHTGLSAQELQKWQIVAQQSHASADDVTGSVENLTKHLANLAVGIPDSSLASLQQLGISAFEASGKMKTAFQILGEVRARLAATTADAGQQERILAGLGISPNLRETLLLSEALFKERRSFVPGMSVDQEKKFDHLRETMVEIELRTRQIGTNIAAWISPAVQKIFDIFNTVAGEELKGGSAWMDAIKRSQDSMDRAKKEGRPFEFKDSVLGQIIFGVDRGVGKNYVPQFTDPSQLGVRDYVTARTPPQVNIEKHDTYNIYDANDPQKVKEVIERHWDETLQKKTVDGFDRQLNNGGY